MAVTFLKNKAAYSIVKLNEYGSPVEFYVKEHNYESSRNGSGRTLLVRKDCWPEKMQMNNTRTLIYENSDLDTWFNTTYKAAFDDKIQDVIAGTKFTWIKDVFTGDMSSGHYVTTYHEITRSVFTLDCDDFVGSDVLRIAYSNGNPVRYWSNHMLLGPAGEGNEVNRNISATGEIVNGGPTSTYYARPCITLPETALVLDDGTVVIDAAPAVSGSDGDLGTFSASAPSISYTVTDAEDDAVTVTIKLDGAVIKTHTVTLGQVNAYQLSADEWRKVLNGAHTLKIIAADGYLQTERTYTFTKSVTSMSFTLAEPLPADDVITKALESIIGELPTGAAVKIEVCNNGYDDSPTWQDVTQAVLGGNKFQMTNATKTAAKWGYNVRVTVNRGSATGDIYINSMGGFFE